jgi:hypothetical protein
MEQNQQPPTGVVPMYYVPTWHHHQQHSDNQGLLSEHQQQQYPAIYPAYAQPILQQPEEIPQQQAVSDTHAVEQTESNEPAVAINYAVKSRSCCGPFLKRFVIFILVAFVLTALVLSIINITRRRQEVTYYYGGGGSPPSQSPGVTTTLTISQDPSYYGYTAVSTTPNNDTYQGAVGYGHQVTSIISYTRGIYSDADVKLISIKDTVVTVRTSANQIAISVMDRYDVNSVSYYAPNIYPASLQNITSVSLMDNVATSPYRVIMITFTTSTNQVYSINAFIYPSTRSILIIGASLTNIPHSTGTTNRKDVKVVAFKSAAVAILVSDTITKAYNVILCRVQESSQSKCTTTTVTTTKSCLFTPSVYGVGSSTSDVAFFVNCPTKTGYRYRWEQSSQTFVNTYNPPSQIYFMPANMVSVDNTTIISYTVDGSALSASVITLQFTSNYDRTPNDFVQYYHNQGNQVLIASDVLNTAAVQINIVKSQVFFTYMSKSTRKYVTVAAGLVGTKNSDLALDVSEQVIDVAALSGVTGAPTTVVVDNSQLYYMFPAVNNNAAIMKMTVRGNIRPLGIADVSKSYTTRTVTIAGTVSPPTFFKLGARYYAARDGTLTLSKQDKYGFKNYFVGTFTSSNSLLVAMSATL